MTETTEPASVPDYFLHPPPRRLGVLALLERNGFIAVISRSYWTEISRWGIPGGSAAPNELPRRALSRLAAEKLGLRITPGALLAIDFAPAVPGRYVEGANYVFHVPVPTGTEITLTPGCGYTDIRWAAPQEVHYLAIEHELWRIQQALEALETGTCRDLLLGTPLPSTGYAAATAPEPPAQD